MVGDESSAGIGSMRLILKSGAPVNCQFVKWRYTMNGQGLIGGSGRVAGDEGCSVSWRGAERSEA
jgi:hypothetical protein